MIRKLLATKIQTAYPDLDKIFSETFVQPVTVTFLNPLSIKVLKSNKEYVRYLNTVDYMYSDGMLLCKLVEVLSGKHCVRVSFDGNSLAPAVFKHCRKRNSRVALIGTTDENIKSAVEKLKSEINIVYYRNGFFEDEEEINCMYQQLKEYKVDVVIFGMGVPFQERMLYLLKQKKINILAFTCGGYLEQVAKRDIQFYPEFYNKYNLRWLYRIFHDPVRLLKRYTLDYSPFYTEYTKVIAGKIFKPLKKRSSSL